MEKLSLTGKSKHNTDESMRGLSAVLVNGNDIFIDNGAIHAKSRLERGLTYVKRREEIENAREVIGFWITLHRFDQGQGYYGAMPFRLYIDEAAQKVYKSLAEQVNGMDKAVHGQVQVEDVPQEVRTRVGEFLKTVRSDLWEQAQDTFRTAFSE
ncbi:YwhD family protein [Alicyclobacillus tolerans]|uniref:YwhD family protein n=1 Tax=Alicyclobacillus tolerans TaxID=90970 RepID=UPI001F32F28B|nr:YwhD family protein [Alicyclobacillus tolerans]MCF8565369.1 YwhD family protein [Alicyclobacillus tolerans]